MALTKRSNNGQNKRHVARPNELEKNVRKEALANTSVNEEEIEGQITKEAPWRKEEERDSFAYICSFRPHAFWIPFTVCIKTISNSNRPGNLATPLIAHTIWELLLDTFRPRQVLYEFNIQLLPTFCVMFLQ